MNPVIGLGLVGLGLVGVGAAKKPSTMSLPAFRPGFGWFKTGKRPIHAPQSGNGIWLYTAAGWIWYPTYGTMALMNGNVWVANTTEMPVPPPGAGGRGGRWRLSMTGPGSNQYWIWAPPHRGG